MKTRTMDKLTVSLKKATKVYCIQCHQHIAYLKREKNGVRVENLAPLAGEPQPTDFNCPRCGQIYVAFSPKPTIRTNRGYIS